MSLSRHFIAEFSADLLRAIRQQNPEFSDIFVDRAYRVPPQYASMTTSQYLGIGICLLAFMGRSTAEPKWTEVRSPHFRVVTSGSEGAGRRVAREFELMRTVFETQFPHFRLDSNAPLLVVVPRDRIITEGLDINERVAGIYLHGWERQYALVRLDALNTDVYHPDVYAPVYHEYIHSLLHVSFDRIPRWLDEGLAEFFAYTRFEGDRMYIGAFPKDTHYTEILDRRVNMPLAEFVMKRSAFARDEDDTHLFYAQSWALTHFLTFGPGMEGGARLNAFMTQLQTGVDQKKAFETVFGPFEQVQKDYEMYLRKFTFTSGILPAPAGLKERDFVARQLSIG